MYKYNKITLRLRDGAAHSATKFQTFVLGFLSQKQCEIKEKSQLQSCRVSSIQFEMMPYVKKNLLGQPYLLLLTFISDNLITELE